MEIILLLSLDAFFLTVFVAVIRFTASEELDWWIHAEAEDREELPKVTFKQIKSFVLLGKVEKYQKRDNDYSCYIYKTIFLCNGEKFTFTNWFELKKYNDFQKNIEKEKKAIKHRLIQAEFLKHLQKTVNAEYDQIIEEVKDKK